MCLIKGAFVGEKNFEIFVTMQICGFTVAAERDRMEEVSRG
jgi:hypothetical protein